MLGKLDTTALAVAVGIFVLALAFALVLRRFDIKDGVMFVTLLILPFAAYGVASGYISELTGPGGWGAKFREVAAADAEFSPIAAEIEDLRIVEKSSLAALDQRRGSLAQGEPVAMTLQLGRGGYYSPRAIAIYARTLLTFDPKMTVVFVGEDNRFVASSNGASVMAAMENEEQGYELVNAMERGDLESIRGLVGLTTASVAPGDSNADVLARMMDDRVDTLIHVDAGGRPTGVVRRDDIVAQLLVKLASG